jgi:RNA recognition motif-containing protein
MMMTDRKTGRARAFAFVEMADATQADRVISEMNGRSLDGRPLTFNEDDPKGERSFPRKEYSAFGQNDRTPRRGRESRWQWGNTSLKSDDCRADLPSIQRTGGVIGYLLTLKQRLAGPTSSHAHFSVQSK